jgi:hypothetical protein
LAIARALSRAASCIEREILRVGVFGQHFGLSAQALQSRWMAR